MYHPVVQACVLLGVYCIWSRYVCIWLWISTA